MSNYNYMAGSSYGSRFHAPQDDCWDQLCPLNIKAADPAREKLECLKNKMSAVCDCCKKSGLPDCEILIPGKGLVDPCKMLHQGSGGAKDHFCDCVVEVCPNCRSRDEFLKNQQAVIDCCQEKCTGGSCDYDCNQIGLSYLLPQSLMGNCLPEEKSPPTSPTEPIVTKTPEHEPSFFNKHKTWIFVIIGLILAIIAVILIGLYLHKKKGGKRKK